jgi:hypothetical protein
VLLGEGKWLVSEADAAIRMPRRFIWIEEIRFRGFGCSSGSPTGNSFDEMMRNFRGPARHRVFISRVR